MTTKDEVLARVEEHDVRFVDLWFTDISGGVKSVTIPVSEIEATIDLGRHFDGSSLESQVRVAESDMILLPDLNTFTVLPWAAADVGATARLICNVHTTNGDPFIGDPRQTLIRMLKQAQEMGFRYKTGYELEFYLFGEVAETPIDPVDEGTYFDLSPDTSESIRRRMIATLSQLGMRVESAHHEIGSGQHEIGFGYDVALAAADQMLTARVALKAVAREHGLRCTFMPRPSSSLPGSGMHTHQSLHDLATDDNVFHNSDNQYGLSTTAQYFLAGQLCYARAMVAILAPVVNSYKRLGRSVEAPNLVTWAHINRAALIRVPSIRPGLEQHTRLELRCPDPTSNPYLASAVMLQAGLEGIRQKMSLDEPLEEILVSQSGGRRRHLESLPNSLGEAIDALQSEEVILSALGPYISGRYIDVKQQEYDEYNRQVTTWEVQRYFDRY